jgi:hypothetical protein
MSMTPGPRALRPRAPRPPASPLPPPPPPPLITYPPPGTEFQLEPYRLWENYSNTACVHVYDTRLQGPQPTGPATPGLTSPDSPPAAASTTATAAAAREEACDGGDDTTPEQLQPSGKGPHTVTWLGREGVC